jgi:hypothetical protein
MLQDFSVDLPQKAAKNEPLANSKHDKKMVKPKTFDFYNCLVEKKELSRYKGFVPPEESGINPLNLQVHYLQVPNGGTALPSIGRKTC